MRGFFKPTAPLVHRAHCLRNADNRAVLSLEASWHVQVQTKLSVSPSPMRQKVVFTNDGVSVVPRLLGEITGMIASRQNYVRSRYGQLMR
jgi:hypothetical protein